MPQDTCCKWFFMVRDRDFLLYQTKGHEHLSGDPLNPDNRCGALCSERLIDLCFKTCPCIPCVGYLIRLGNECGAVEAAKASPNKAPCPIPVLVTGACIHPVVTLPFWLPAECFVLSAVQCSTGCQTHRKSKELRALKRATEEWIHGAELTEGAFAILTDSLRRVSRQIKTGSDPSKWECDMLRSVLVYKANEVVVRLGSSSEDMLTLAPLRSLLPNSGMADFLRQLIRAAFPVGTASATTAEQERSKAAAVTLLNVAPCFEPRELLSVTLEEVRSLMASVGHQAPAKDLAVEDVPSQAEGQAAPLAAAPVQQSMDAAGGSTSALCAGCLGAPAPESVEVVNSGGQNPVSLPGAAADPGEANGPTGLPARRGSGASAVEEGGALSRMARCLVTRGAVLEVSRGLSTSPGTGPGGQAERELYSVLADKPPLEYYFLDANKVRQMGTYQPLPRFQEALKAGLLVKLMVQPELALLGAFGRNCLVVSHRWMRPGIPDTDCSQLRALKEHLDKDRAVQLVWQDWSCMPQGERTPEEQAYFKKALRDVNILYLTMKVLILLDASYQGRFWCIYESWCAMRSVKPEGLMPAGDNERRWTVACLGSYKNSAEKNTAALEEAWHKVGTAVALENMRSDDIQVTNQSDKEQQIVKLQNLEKDMAAHWQDLLKAGWIELK